MCLTKIQESVNFIFGKFSLNPYRYFYEEDLRVELGYQLLENFDSVSFKNRDNVIKTSPIKFEYPSSLKNGKRHDIVLLKPNEYNDIYNCDISCAIELKLGSKITDRCADFKEDLKKLSNYKMKEFIGIALFFYQDNVAFDLLKKWFEDISSDFEVIKLNGGISINYGNNFYIVRPGNEIIRIKSLKIL